MQQIKHRIAAAVDRFISSRANGPELAGLMFIALAALLFVALCAALGAWLGWRVGVAFGVGMALGAWIRGRVW